MIELEVATAAWGKGQVSGQRRCQQLACCPHIWCKGEATAADILLQLT